MLQRLNRKKGPAAFTVWYHRSGRTQRIREPLGRRRRVLCSHENCLGWEVTRSTNLFKLEGRWTASAASGPHFPTASTSRRPPEHQMHWLLHNDAGVTTAWNFPLFACCTFHVDFSCRRETLSHLESNLAVCCLDRFGTLLTPFILLPIFQSDWRTTLEDVIHEGDIISCIRPFACQLGQDKSADFDHEYTRNTVKQLRGTLMWNCFRKMFALPFFLASVVSNEMEMQFVFTRKKSYKSFCDFHRGDFCRYQRKDSSIRHSIQKLMGFCLLSRRSSTLQPKQDYFEWDPLYFCKEKIEWIQRKIHEGSTKPSPWTFTSTLKRVYFVQIDLEKYQGGPKVTDSTHAWPRTVLDQKVKTSFYKRSAVLEEHTDDNKVMKEFCVSRKKSTFVFLLSGFQWNWHGLSLLKGCSHEHERCVDSECPTDFWGNFSWF